MYKLINEILTALNNKLMVGGTFFGLGKGLRLYQPQNSVTQIGILWCKRKSKVMA